jgi:hypothetical protein
MVEEIKNKIKKLLLKNINLSEGDVSYMLTLMGKIVEIYELKGDYGLVKFYRDFSQHAIISINQEGKDIFNKIEIIFSQNIDFSDRQNLTRILSQELLLDEFLRQSQELMNFLKIETDFFRKKESVENFLKLLFSILNNSSIQIETKTQKLKTLKFLILPSESIGVRGFAGKSLASLKIYFSDEFVLIPIVWPRV